MVNLVPRAIDGVLVEPGKESYYPIAVMIENHVDSRPPAGLSRANLVYEAEAEGGITRFMAIFASGDNIERIGPVRSARPYYIDWAKELNAVYVHCGGSPDALVKLSKDKVFDLNEFYNSALFWRDKSRSAPHNVYISTAKLTEYLQKKNLSISQYQEWQYKDASSTEEISQGTNIDIFYKNNQYMVQWKYDLSTNEYVRYLAGNIHKDEDDKEIRAKNIVILKTSSTIVDEKLRLNTKTIGTGESIVCLDGVCQTGIWKKRDNKSRIIFYKKTGEEFELNRGTTWVEVVRINQKIEYPPNSQ
jgi:hypothetical protein